MAVDRRGNVTGQPRPTNEQVAGWETNRFDLEDLRRSLVDKMGRLFAIGDARGAVDVVVQLFEVGMESDRPVLAEIHRARDREETLEIELKWTRESLEIARNQGAADRLRIEEQEGQAKRRNDDLVARRGAS